MNAFWLSGMVYGTFPSGKGKCSTTNWQHCQQRVTRRAICLSDCLPSSPSPAAPSCSSAWIREVFLGPATSLNGALMLKEKSSCSRFFVLVSALRSAPFSSAFFYYYYYYFYLFACYFVGKYQLQRRRQRRISLLQFRNSRFAFPK